MSNGGFMTSTVACRMSDKVAAVAVVAATLPAGLEAECGPSRPVPAMIVMGDRDPLVPYGGGEIGRLGARGRALSAADTARFWAKVDGCSAPPATTALPDTDPGDGTRTTLLRFAPCQSGAEVDLFTVEGGGHAWPGGLAYLGEWIIGKTSRDWDASEEIWRFFAPRRLQ
jgi:polyhydroxybutyrate depolymerase